MDLKSILLENPGAIAGIAKTLGLGSNDAKTGILELLPALTRGLGNNAKKSGGLESLLGALKSGNHSRYLDKPELLGEPASVEEGNSILGHILGSKDVSRNVAGKAAERSGLSASILKKMLPMLATLAMGGLSKQSKGGADLGSLLGSAISGLSGSKSGASQGLDMLTSFLDSDNDGSALDDVLNLAKRFF